MTFHFDPNKSVFAQTVISVQSSVSIFGSSIYDSSQNKQHPFISSRKYWTNLSDWPSFVTTDEILGEPNKVSS